jgi:outer membrane protein assembly factor BamB
MLDYSGRRGNAPAAGRSGRPFQSIRQPFHHILNASSARLSKDGVMDGRATPKAAVVGAAACLAVVLAAMTSARLLAADWPAFRGPTHDGISTERLVWPRNGPKEKWRINVGIGHSAVSVVGKRAYTMGNANETDTVYSIDIDTGKVVWTHSYPCNEKVGIKDYDGPFATPAVADGVVYTLSRKGDLFALDAKRGTVIWQRNIVQQDDVRPPGFGGLAGSPLVLGEKLIVNGSSGGMALDRKTGKPLWKSGTGSGGHATPVPMRIAGRTYLAIHGPRTLTIVDAADGKEFWTTPRRQPIGVNAPDPVVDGTRVFVTAGRAFGGALFDVTGGTSPLWEQVGLSSHWHTSVLVNGVLYGPDGNNSEGAGRSPTSLRSVDWRTGEIKWTEPKLGFNGLIAVGGTLLVLTETGDLVLVEASPTAYKELGSARVIEGRVFTAPSFADGRVYARNTKGDVVCLELAPK